MVVALVQDFMFFGMQDGGTTGISTCTEAGQHCMDVGVVHALRRTHTREHTL